MLNIAIGLSIILWSTGILIFVFIILTPLRSLLPVFKEFTSITNLVTSPIGFSITVLIIFLLLRFTKAYKYLNPSSRIQSIFGISNFVILTDMILLAIDNGNERGNTKTVFQEVLNTIISTAPILVLGLLLGFFPAIIMLIFGTLELITQSHQKLKEQSPNGDRRKDEIQTKIAIKWGVLNIAIALSFILWSIAIFVTTLFRFTVLLNLLNSFIVGCIFVTSFYLWLSLSNLYENFKPSIQSTFLVFNALAIAFYLKSYGGISWIIILSSLMQIVLVLGLIIVLVRAGFLTAKIFHKK